MGGGYEAGDLVLACSSDAYNFYGARVVRHLEHGVYEIEWEDGYDLDTVKDARDLQPLLPEGAHGNAHLAHVNDGIERRGDGSRNATANNIEHWQHTQPARQLQDFNNNNTLLKGYRAFISNVFEDAAVAAGGYFFVGGWGNHPCFKHVDESIFLFWKSGYWVVSHALGVDEPCILECIDERGHEQHMSLMPPATAANDSGDWAVVTGSGQPQVHVRRGGTVVLRDMAAWPKAWIEKDAKRLPDNFFMEHSADESWKRYVDNSGKPYWYNYVTRKVQWQKPDGFAPSNSPRGIQQVGRPHHKRERQRAHGEVSIAEQRRAKARAPGKLTGLEPKFAVYRRSVVRAVKETCSVCHTEYKNRRSINYCWTCNRPCCSTCRAIVGSCMFCEGELQESQRGGTRASPATDEEAD